MRKHHEDHVDESIRLSEQAARLAEHKPAVEEAPALNAAIPHLPECSYWTTQACNCVKTEPAPQKL